MIGSIAVAVVLTASLVGAGLYVLVARGKAHLLTAARWSTYAAITGVFTAAATLLYYIFSYRFDINYVYEHVSRSLSKPLLFSTFYASQEGSFMLWAVWTAIIAIFLIKYSSRQRYESYVMPIFLTVLAFLGLMLVAKSPFETIYAAHPGEAQAGFIPADGKGLNPSLENLWIVIHPPMLFLGFSLLAVPFAFAIAGLLKRDYQGWVTTSLPWILGAGGVLGFGIMLGGFWAYETLGWGGYWAWDPVENSSLLPWLITIASAHTMLTQKRTGGLVKTNIAMTLLAYGLVLYSSFLTRSGILGEASVHSFADPGNLAFTLLVGALAFFVLGSVIVFFLRWKELRTVGQEYKILSRETSLSIGSAILGASALVVFIGTSAPLVAKKVDTDFYNNLHIPIAIALMLVNGLSLLLKWKQSSLSEMRKKATVALVLTAICTIIVVALGLREVNFIMMVAASLFALFVNLEIGFQVMKGHFKVSYVNAAASMKDLNARFKTAFGIGLTLAVIVLLVGTAGDYNLFGPMILQYWPIFVIGQLVILAFFAIMGYLKIEANTKFLGAYVSHMGVALFILGVIASAHYSEKQILQLPQNTPVKAFGKYIVTYKGFQYTEPDNYHWIINVDEKGKSIGVARPLWYWTDFNNRQQPIVNPSILKYAARDLYFTTQGVDQTGGVPKDTLGKGQSVVAYNGGASVKFIDFDFPQEERAKMISQQPFTVKAMVEVTNLREKGAQPIPLILSVTKRLNSMESTEEDVKVPGTKFHVQLAELKPDMSNRDNSKIVVRTFDEDNPPAKATQVITVEAFIKPYINLVWAGILILVAGFWFSTKRRKREAVLAIEKAEKNYEKLLAQRSKKVESQGPVPAERSHFFKREKKEVV